ncbi:hypothetical protein [Amycolatopsis sp. cmx-4-61]|uniref:hypothetical protein n=1 Tax=Amycolatopsis sp. cmx-4-61 TaxID=2790937 RepID=UPI00397E2256
MASPEFLAHDNGIEFRKARCEAFANRSNRGEYLWGTGDLYAILGQIAQGLSQIPSSSDAGTVIVKQNSLNKFRISVNDNTTRFAAVMLAGADKIDDIERSLANFMVAEPDHVIRITYNALKDTWEVVDDLKSAISEHDEQSVATYVHVRNLMFRLVEAVETVCVAVKDDLAAYKTMNDDTHGIDENLKSSLTSFGEQTGKVVDLTRESANMVKDALGKSWSFRPEVIQRTVADIWRTTSAAWYNDAVKKTKIGSRDLAVVIDEKLGEFNLAFSPDPQSMDRRMTWDDAVKAGVDKIRPVDFKGDIVWEKVYLITLDKERVPMPIEADLTIRYDGSQVIAILGAEY